MSGPPLSRDPEPLQAGCTRCDDWRDSDPLTFEEALRAGWAVIRGQLICPDHLVPCTRCGDPCLLASDGCVKDGDFHCDEHAGDCSDCGRFEAAEREPHDD